MCPDLMTHLASEIAIARDEYPDFPPCFVIGRPLRERLESGRTSKKRVVGTPSVYEEACDPVTGNRLYFSEHWCNAVVVSGSGRIVLTNKDVPMYYRARTRIGRELAMKDHIAPARDIGSPIFLGFSALSGLLTVVSITSAEFLWTISFGFLAAVFCITGLITRNVNLKVHAENESE